MGFTLITKGGGGKKNNYVAKQGKNAGKSTRGSAGLMRAKKRLIVGVKEKVEYSHLEPRTS